MNKTPFTQWIIHQDQWIMVGILSSGKKIIYRIKPSLKLKSLVCTIESDNKVIYTQTYKTITAAKNFVMVDWENRIKI